MEVWPKVRLNSRLQAPSWKSL